LCAQCCRLTTAVSNGDIIGVMQSILAVGGLLLVFSGFMLSRAKDFQSKRGDKFTVIGKLGLVPLLLICVSTGVCTAALEGNSWALAHVMLLFNWALAFSGIYAIIALALA